MGVPPKNQELEDAKLIKRAYRKLLRSIKTNLDATDRSNIRMAYELAVEAHSKQRRKSGEPYILHPIEVARICTEEIGLGPTAIVCALLHDVVEDTDIDLQEIELRFGSRIAKIVDGLTKLDGSYQSYDFDSPQAKNFQKVLSTLVEDVRVVLIKMADRLHNMRTLGAMPRHKQLKIAAETSYIYSPLAHRLGLYNVKTEFQDLCMKIMEPEAYEDINQKLQATQSQRTRYINDFIKPLTQQLDEIGAPYRITGRPKSISSIWNKLQTKKVPFEQIYDLFAVRIILDAPPKKEKSLCWQVYSIVTDVYTPIPERLKDWVTTPKSNGYESLHTTVIGPKGRFVEVQIRTERMDEIAERGFAAHWKYKGISGQPNMYEQWLDSIREMLENESTDAVEFISDFKTNLFNEEVYIFTPKGEMKVLPKGATALDFAFGIHSDIGYHCTSIMVNNKLVPMGYQLQNGDQIKVTTSKNQKPSESWLKMVVTGRARAKIRSALKEERRLNAGYGKEALERKLKNLKVDFEENIDMLVKHFGFTTRLDLYYAIYSEDINLQNAFKNFRPDGHKLVFVQKEKPKESLPAPPPRTKKEKYTGRPKILVNGQSAEQYQYSLATCCNPVQGDDIFAYLTTTSGLKIHRTSCPNATHLMANYGYRVMNAEWINTNNTTFIADLLITGVDSGVGVIEGLSNIVSTELGLNIRSFSIAGDEGYFEGKMSLVVSNINQLNIAMQALRNFKGISSVTRTNE